MQKHIINMDLGKELQPMLTFSLIDWLKNKKLQKLLLISIIVYSLFSIILTYFGIQRFSGLSEITNPLELIGPMIEFYIVLGLTLIPVIIILTIVQYITIAKGLELKKKKSMKLDFVRFIKFLFLPLVTTIVAGLSLFDIKKLLIGIIGFLISVMGLGIFFISPVFGAILILIGTLLLVAYGIIFIINNIRLSVSDASFVESHNSLIKALKHSWVITRGNVLNIFIIWVVFSVIVMIITYIAIIPSMAFLILNTAIIETSKEESINFILNPIYNALMIPSYIITAYAIICQSLLTVSIFSKLEKKK